MLHPLNGDFATIKSQRCRECCRWGKGTVCCAHTVMMLPSGWGRGGCSFCPAVNILRGCRRPSARPFFFYCLSTLELCTRSGKKLVSQWEAGDTNRKNHLAQSPSTLVFGRRIVFNRSSALSVKSILINNPYSLSSSSFSCSLCRLNFQPQPDVEGHAAPVGPDL